MLLLLVFCGDYRALRKKKITAIVEVITFEISASLLHYIEIINEKETIFAVSVFV